MARRATWGMIWTALGSLAARGLGFLTTIGLTHIVDRAEYGRASAAHTLAEIIGAVSSPLVRAELIRRRRHFREACGVFVVYGTGLMLLTCGAAYLAAEPLCRLFNAPGAAGYLRVALLIPLTAIAGSVAHVALTRDMRFGTLGMIEAGGAVANTAGAFGLALAGARGLSVVVGQLTRELFIRIAGVAVTGVRWIRLPGPGHGRLLREMVAFGMPVYISVLFEFSATHGDNLFISRMFGPAMLGPYAVAYTVAYTPVYTVMQRVSSVILAAVALMQDDAPRRQRALLRSLGAVMVLIAPVVVLLMLTGPRISSLIFPGRWSDLVGQLITALALVGVGLPLQFVSDYYFQAVGRPAWTMAIMGTKATALFAALFAMGRANVVDAAWSVSFAFVFIGVAALGMLSRVDGIRLSRLLAQVLPAAAGGAAAAAAILALRPTLLHLGDAPALALEVLAGLSTYAAYLALFHRPRVADILSAIRGG